MEHGFDKVRGNFGFGCMRLPMQNGEVDMPEFTRMVDAFMAAGLNYFDTARVYINGKSEVAMRHALVERYPRESFVFTNKLTSSLFRTAEDILPLFEQQLASCGVDYFDFYLMHSQQKSNYDKYNETGAYRIAAELREKGRIRHLGLSFHDRADFLDRILREHPEVEVVQLQYNYLDVDDPVVQSRRCLEVCRAHGKPVIVMEPVRGGALVNLPPEALALIEGLHGDSPAGYAIRYAADTEGVMMVLSGMSNMAQMEDNLRAMQPPRPLTDRERDVIERIRGIFAALDLIPCTACRYCVDGCPKQIRIPELFDAANNRLRGWGGGERYRRIADEGKGPDVCIGCGKCEKICPQHLPVRSLLGRVSDLFSAGK